MTRDRRLTSARILAAAEGLIAREGVPAAGINAIAEAAGVDKVLIYRYFGGRVQLLSALARERRVCPTITLSTADAGVPSTLAGDLAAALLDGARALRDHHFLRRMAVWQLTEHDDFFAREIAAAQAMEERALAAALRVRHQIPRFVDLDALIAVLGAALAQLALRGAAAGPHGDRDSRRRDEEWARTERTVLQTVQAIFGSSD